MLNMHVSKQVFNQLPVWSTNEHLIALLNIFTYSCSVPISFGTNYTAMYGQINIKVLMGAATHATMPAAQFEFKKVNTGFWLEVCSKRYTWYNHRVQRLIQFNLSIYTC